MGVSHKVHSALTLSLSPLSPSLSSVSVSAPAHSDRPGYPGPGGPGLSSPGWPGPGKLLWAESRRQQQPGERRPWDAGDGAAASGYIEHQSQQLRQRERAGGPRRPTPRDARPRGARACARRRDAGAVQRGAPRLVVRSSFASVSRLGRSPASASCQIQILYGPCDLSLVLASLTAPSRVRTQVTAPTHRHTT